MLKKFSVLVSLSEGESPKKGTRNRRNNGIFDL